MKPLEVVFVATPEGKPSWIYGHGQKVVEYIKKHSGRHIKAVFEDASAKFVKKNPKTAEQLGWYFAVLLPEIHKQLLADGHTITVRFGTITKEIKLSEDDAHEAITFLCGNVGEGGQFLRLSQCGLRQCVNFLDNVLDLAAQLNMNVEELKACRPKKKKDIDENENQADND